jgi:ATPase
MQKIVGNSMLDQYFEEDVMSLHLKEKIPFARKKGQPGAVEVVIDPKEIATKEFLYDLIDKIFAEIAERDDGFLEIDRSLLKIVQL